MNNAIDHTRVGLAFLIAASVASSIGGLPFNTLPILLGAFADQLALGPADLGSLGSACTGGYLLSTMLGPLWVDRVPWRIATIVAAVGTAAALWWSANVAAAPLVPLAAFGFAAGLMHSLGMRMVGEAANKERAFGLRLLTELVIVAALLFFLPIVIASAAIRGGMGLLAIAVLVMAISAFFIPRGPATSDAQTASADSASASRVDAIGWFALGIFVLFACGQVALWVFVERIGRSIDVSAAEMGSVFAVLKVIGGASAALVALLGDRLGNRLPHLLGLLLISLGVALLALRTSFWVYAFGAWIWEGAFTMCCVYQTAAVARLDRSNKLVVLVPAAFAISAFIGPELAGRLAEANGFAPLFGLAIGCAAIPALAYWLFAHRMTAANHPRTA